MNDSVSDWNFGSDTFFTNQNKPMGFGDELMELLWENGEVVMHSQTNKKPDVNTNIINSRHVEKNLESTTLRTSEPFNNSNNMVQEDGTVSWIQYPLVDHPLEQEFCSNLLSELPSCVDVESFKQIKQFDEGKFSTLDASGVQQPHLKPSFVQELPRIPMPDPRFNNVVDSSQRNNDLGGSNKVQNFSHFSRPPIVSLASANGNTQLIDKVSGSLSQCGIRERPVMTVGLSSFKINQVQQDLDVSRLSKNGVWTTTIPAEPQLARDVVQKTIPQHEELEKGKSEMLERIIPSSSGGSGSSHGKNCPLSTRIHDKKRKSVDIEDPMQLSEDKEHKLGVQNKGTQRSASARRNRAAEVHNLSERKRRDRINEKMKALQQLIPHSNKTDKASMLDEAIEYLKSLQLQLQVLWMGYAGMGPMMHPGFQHYMSQMGMGMTPPSFPPLQNPMQIPRMPPLDPAISASQAPNPALMSQNPMLGAFNYQSQMPNPALSEQFARFMSYQLMQNASQPMNMNRYGPQATQHSQTMMHPGNISGPMSGATNINDVLSGKMG